jgi:hypothetical protein
LRLILRRMRQRPFVLKDLAEITAIDPSAAGWAKDEVIGLALGWTLTQELPTSRIDHLCRCLQRAGFLMWIIAQKSLVNLSQLESMISPLAIDGQLGAAVPYCKMGLASHARGAIC